MVEYSTSQGQLRSWLAPRYTEKLLRAASLIAAGISVVAFLAIGEKALVFFPIASPDNQRDQWHTVWVALYSTTLRHFKFFRELVGRG